MQRVHRAWARLRQRRAAARISRLERLAIQGSSRAGMRLHELANAGRDQQRAATEAISRVLARRSVRTAA